MSLRPPKKELVALYLRYRALADGLRSLPALSQVTADLEPLLVTIVNAWHEGQAFPVRKLLIREALGSPATIHKRIHQLKSAGLVDFEGLETDSRVRLVVPTEQALRYLAEQGKAVQMANR